jgi:hypothetical protein
MFDAAAVMRRVLSLNNFRSLGIYAKPVQIPQTNQSNCEADGYISIRAPIPQNADRWRLRAAAEQPVVGAIVLQ